nr:PH domain-containing protein [Erythrobacter crassostrea]
MVGTLAGLKNAIFPAAAAAFGTGLGGMGLYIGIGVGLLIAVVGGVASYISWRRLSYTIGASDIRVESGVLSRAARSVPYERIQDVSLEQKLIPRLLGLVAVKFETGAGGGEDLSLTYLTEESGEELRQLVRERRDAQDEIAPDAETGVPSPAREPEAEGEPIFAMGTGRLFQFGLFEFSLAVFAVLLGLLQYADTFIDFEIWDPDLWQGVLEEQGSTISALGPYAQIASAIGGLIALFVVGSATGMIRVFTREWDFLLERTARGFRRRRGLFTKTDVVMPIHRVQALKIGTRLIRYRFGWHNLKFVSLAQDAGSSSHDVAPFAKMDEIRTVVETAGFHLPSENADWHRASEAYRTDSMIVDSLFFVIAAIVAGTVLGIFNPDWFLLVVAILLGLAALSAGAALYSWQFKRHSLDDTQIMARAGIMSPSSQIATRTKLHSAEVAQGPIARWRGYATLHLGLAGGEFAIPGIPFERAREVRREVLETIAATDFSELETG